MTDVSQKITAVITIDPAELISPYENEYGDYGPSSVMDQAVNVLAKKLKKEIGSAVVDRLTAEIDAQISSIVQDALTKEFEPRDECGRSTGSPTTLEQFIRDRAAAWLRNITSASNNSYNESAGQKWIRQVVEGDLRSIMENEIKAAKVEIQKHMQSYAASILAKKMLP